MPSLPFRLPVRSLLVLAVGLTWPLALSGCGEEASKTSPTSEISPEAVKTQQNSMEFMKSQAPKRGAKR